MGNRNSSQNIFTLKIKSATTDCGGTGKNIYFINTVSKKQDPLCVLPSLM